MQNRPGVLGACLTALLVAGRVGADPAQLDQINRANAQALERLQQQVERSAVPRSLFDRQAKRALDRRQIGEQRALQERQHRRYLGRKLRDRVMPTPVPRQRLDSIDQRYRFELQQRRQLDRFEWQQGIAPR